MFDRELTDFSNQTGRRERWWRVVARGAEHPGDRRDEGQGVDIDRVGFSLKYVSYSGTALIRTPLPKPVIANSN